MSKTSHKNPKRKVYLLDYRLTFKAFKLLQKKLVRISGPVPVHGERGIWEMMKRRQICCWFDPKIKGDMMLCLPEQFKKRTKNKMIMLIENYGKQ